MTRAENIVYRLLEGDPDDIIAKDYLKQSDVWHSVDLITSREWRAFFRNLGWRVKSFYRARSGSKRRYGLISMTLASRDGHSVDYQDEALVRDYVYDFLEAKFGKRSSKEFPVYVDAYAYGTGANATAVELNQIDINIREPDEQDRIEYMYLSQHVAR